jgi:hypothetical protein
MALAAALLASLSIVGVYVAMRFVSDLLDLPAGYATPGVPACRGRLRAGGHAGGWRVLPAIALGAALLHLPGTWLARRCPARRHDAGRHHHARLGAAGLAGRRLVPAPGAPGARLRRATSAFLMLAPVPA